VQKECLFGDIVGGKRLNECGRIVEKNGPEHQRLGLNIEIDIFVVMPNHFHGIMIINGVGDSCRGVLQYAPTKQCPPIPNTSTERTFRSPSQTVGAIIRGFKSTLAKQINQIRNNTPGHPIWQRNYYEHVIRNEENLNHIRQYIVDNPMKWVDDEDNPEI
jgi:REP element-mobilizing transposase RayT